MEVAVTDHTLNYAQPSRRLGWLKIVVLGSLVTAGIAGFVMRAELREAAAPVGRWYDEWQRKRQSAAMGRADAERDWKAGMPRIMSDAETIAVDLPEGDHEVYYDGETGLPFRPTFEVTECLYVSFDASYETAYNATIHELIERHGKPSTSWLAWEDLARRLLELAEAAEWQAVDGEVREQWVVFGNSRVFVADVAEDPALQLVKVSTPYYDDVAWVDYYLTEVATKQTIARVGYRSTDGG